MVLIVAPASKLIPVPTCSVKAASLYHVIVAPATGFNTVKAAGLSPAQ